MQKEEKAKGDALELSAEELQEMLSAKTLELSQAIEENAKLQSEKTKLEARTLKVYEENALVKASPEIAAEVARMDYELKLADHFIKSGAFPKMNAAQAYTIIRAGQEMGMKPVEALNSLYIVNGSINPYGKGMIAQMTRAGWVLTYTDETEDGVTVTATHKETGESITEVVTKDDPILKSSSHYKRDPRGKMRFHGARLIANFHLSHLFGGVADLFQSDTLEIKKQEKDRLNPVKVENNKERERIVAHLEGATTPAELNAITGDVVERYDLHEEMNDAANRIHELIEKQQREELPESWSEDTDLFTQIQDNEQGEQTKK